MGWSHRSRLVDVVGLPTIVQPAYSPELNPAERVFEEVWVEGSSIGGSEPICVTPDGCGRLLDGRIEEAVQSLPSHYAASSN